MDIWCSKTGKNKSFSSRSYELLVFILCNIIIAISKKVHQSNHRMGHFTHALPMWDDR